MSSKSERKSSLTVAFVSVEAQITMYVQGLSRFRSVLRNFPPFRSKYWNAGSTEDWSEEIRKRDPLLNLVRKPALANYHLALVTSWMTPVVINFLVPDKKCLNFKLEHMQFSSVLYSLSSLPRAINIAVIVTERRAHLMSGQLRTK